MAFKIFGPHKIELNGKNHPNKNHPNKKLMKEKMKAESPSLPEAKGCYVYAEKSTKTGEMKPIYIGKTNKGFYNEIFQYHKIVKLDKYLGKKEIYIFYIAKITEKGNLSGNGGEGDSRIIGFLENFLIGAASQKNKKLENVKGKKLYGFNIEKLWSDKRRKSETQFSQMLKVETSSGSVSVGEKQTTT
jgi:hypothetical protein